MSEIIFLHIGESGIQMAKECWKLFSHEHDIFINGSLCSPGANNIQSTAKFYKTSSIYNPFFNETENGKLEPRSIMVDLDPTSINKIRRGIFRNLYNSNFLINGDQSSSKIFGRGYFQNGSKIIPTVLNQIRIAADKCESLQGFIIFHSYGGGTGSGLTSLIMQELSQEYPKKVILDFAVYSLPNSSVNLEPYNSILYTHSTIDLPVCTFPLDNKKIYQICRDNFRTEYPVLTNVNQLIAQVASSITSSYRYDGPLKINIQDFQNHLVPTNRIHFPTISLAPVIRCYPFDKQKVFSLKDVTNLLCHPSYKVVNTAYVKDTYFSSIVMLQGETITADEYRLSIRKAKGLCNFAEWCPLNFKFGISNRYPCVMPYTAISEYKYSACMAANRTSIIKPFQDFLEEFDSLIFEKKYLHWYCNEGMEEEDFYFARENVVELIGEYLELQDAKDTTLIQMDEKSYDYKRHWKLRRENFKFSLLENGIWEKRYKYPLKYEDMSHDSD